MNLSLIEFKCSQIFAVVARDWIFWENSWFSFTAGSAFSESQTFLKNLHLGPQKEKWCSLNGWGYLNPEFFKFPWACKSRWNPSQAGLKGNIFYRTFPLEHISLLNLSVMGVIPSTHGTGRINEMYPNKLKCCQRTGSGIGTRLAADKLLG